MSPAAAPSRRLHAAEDELARRLVDGDHHAAVWKVHGNCCGEGQVEGPRALCLHNGPGAVQHAAMVAQLHALLHHVERSHHEVVYQRRRGATHCRVQRVVALPVRPQRHLEALENAEIGGMSGNAAGEHCADATPEPHHARLLYDTLSTLHCLERAWSRSAARVVALVALHVRLERVHGEDAHVLRQAREGPRQHVVGERQARWVPLFPLQVQLLLIGSVGGHSTFRWLAQVTVRIL
mmetsp:Transcript_20134/g.33923  ORF Transcript_20134/g.33923 Transcript_20134/m.33923 type:complete len:237 (+) Transcript_20134:568-1278(+)